VRDRRLGVTELGGRSAERAEVGYRYEGPELAQTDPFSIDQTDRSATNYSGYLRKMLS